MLSLTTVQPPSQTPTYRSFQFADSLEGTKASLQRHSRKNSSVPDYVPSNFNSRVQTQSRSELRPLIGRGEVLPTVL